VVLESEAEEEEEEDSVVSDSSLMEGDRSGGEDMLVLLVAGFDVEGIVLSLPVVNGISVGAAALSHIPSTLSRSAGGKELRKCSSSWGWCHIERGGVFLC